LYYDQVTDDSTPPLVHMDNGGFYLGELT